MSKSMEHSHWLAKYATNYHEWRSSSSSSLGTQCFKRPLGLVETSFDLDGRHYGGRADMNTLLTLKLRHKLSKEALRRQFTLAWANLQLEHTHLMTRVEVNEDTGERNFVVDVPQNIEALVQEAEKSIVWVEDSYSDVTRQEMFFHGMNVTRIIQPDKCLSKVFVLPLKSLPNENFELPLYLVIAHEISDGLAAYSWFRDFLRILNTPLHEIEANINKLCTADSIHARLPPAQEDLYPPVAGNIARQRWFWAIIRVLRHVKKTLPPTFVNPLRRDQRLLQTNILEPKFNRLFDYSREHQPPMSCSFITAALSPSASKRVIELCHASANVSIGAGCFALAGLCMMEIHESRYPDMSGAERPAFVASFPLNPRAFFANPPAADSCMLAFSEGVVMPFLPSSLPIEGRFRLTAKNANRELRMYQKRLRGKDMSKGVGVSFDKHSPSRLLATGYIASLERVKIVSSAAKQPKINPQGSLAPKMGKYAATCGVSSIGSIASFLKSDAYDLNSVSGENMAVDYVDIWTAVRARENEFLIGSWTDASGIVKFGASFDLNAIPQKAAEMWKSKIEGLLDKNIDSKL